MSQEMSIARQAESTLEVLPRKPDGSTYSADQLLRAFHKIIEPIRKFQRQRERVPFISDADVSYTIPARYVKAFANLYDELDRYLKCTPQNPSNEQ